MPESPDEEPKQFVTAKEEIEVEPEPAIASEPLLPEVVLADRFESDEVPKETPVVSEVPLSEKPLPVEAAAEPLEDVISEPVAAAAEPVEAVAAEGVSPAVSGEVISDGGTTPNMGRSGTDGRRSGLKALSEGTLLNNRYRIVKKIGGGGMGAVYLAIRPRTSAALSVRSRRWSSRTSRKSSRKRPSRISNANR